MLVRNQTIRQSENKIKIRIFSEYYRKNCKIIWETAHSAKPKLEGTKQLHKICLPVSFYLKLND